MADTKKSKRKSWFGHAVLLATTALPALALAAYNAGEGRVQRLLDQTKGRSFDDISGRLPSETQMYVPKVEAVIRRREGVALTSLKLQ